MVFYFFEMKHFPSFLVHDYAHVTSGFKARNKSLGKVRLNTQQNYIRAKLQRHQTQ